MPRQEGGRVFYPNEACTGWRALEQVRGFAAPAGVGLELRAGTERMEASCIVGYFARGDVR